MSQFDLAICFGQQNLNNIAAAFYQRPSLRTRLFTGSHAANVQGVQANISWDVQLAPVFNLNPPSAAQWASAIHVTGDVGRPVANAFIVNLPMVHLTLSSAGGPPVPINTAIGFICTISVSGRAVNLVPVAALMDLSKASPIDQLIYTQILIPNLLAQMATLMGGQHVPNINFRGLSFGSFALLVEGGHVTGGAFLEGHPGVPDAQALRAAPKTEFYVLLGREALQKVVQDGVQSLRGQTQGVNGKANFGIGNAHYSASLRLDSLTAQVQTSTSLDVHAGVTLAASAGIDVFSAILDQIAHGVTEPAKAIANVAADAAKASAHAAEQAAKAAAHAAEQAASAVAHGASSAVHTIGHAIKSY